jgi:hypothetical protein
MTLAVRRANQTWRALTVTSPYALDSARHSSLASRALRRVALTLPCFLLVLATCWPVAAETVLCFGDSITRRYVPTLARLRPDWTVVNGGKNGDTSDSLPRLLTFRIRE